MSVGVQAWVWQNSETNGNDRLVLLAIADEADDDGSNAYPSMERLASKCRVNRATVMRTIRRLEADGELIVARPEDYGRGKHNTYLVVMGRDGLSVADCQGLGGARKPSKDQRGRARKGAEGRAQVLPDPKTLRPVDPTPESNPLVVVPDDVQMVLDAYQAATGKQRVARTPERERKIKSALRHYPVGDLVDAVRGWRWSPHHCGENERGTIYNDIELLLRDAKHIEQFRDWERDISRPRVNGNAGPRVSKSRQNSEAFFGRLQGPTGVETKEIGAGQ